MKKFIALFACLVASSAIGQVITYQIRGKISDILNAPEFTAGHVFTLDFSFNKSDLFTPALGDLSIFSASAIKFNYDNGAYVGTIDKTAAVAINAPTGDYFAIGSPFSGNINFPLIEGNPLLSTIPETSNYSFAIINLTDPTGDAFSAGKFMDLAKIGQFTSGFDGQVDDFLNLTWANSDPDRPWVSMVGPIDSIEKISPTLSPVPEPSLYGVMGSLALFGLIARRVKRKQSSSAA